MDLKELKKYADTMDDNGKRELISFLQSRTKGIAVPVRAIDESRNIKMGLFARIAKTILSCDLESMLLKHALERLHVNVTVVSLVAKRSMTLQTPLCNERGDLIFGFALLNA
jgi:hypothetical protein